MELIVQIIIALLIAGFFFWAVRQLVAIRTLEPIFKQIIDVLIIVLVVAVVLLLADYIRGNFLGGIDGFVHHSNRG